MEQERRRRSTGKVDRLPPELKDTVEQMLLTGCTYKEIVAFLKANGEEMSQMAICTYARKYLATVEMINVAQSNFSMLMDEMSREMVGKTITVLNEGWDRYAECCFGRSAADAPEIDTKVFFTVEGKKPYPGMFVQVEITDTMDCDLIGQVVTT